jgi:phosphoglycolate phosphatase-like HAD superfamily hydrolase
MQRWEYYRLSATHYRHSAQICFVNGEELEPPFPNLDTLLSELGEKGWELVGMSTPQGNTTDYILKRPIQS